MKFVNCARYVSDREKINSVRPAHRIYVKGLMEQGRLITGGPFTDDSGALLIYEAETIKEVNEMIADDPYTTDGVFVSCEVKPWECVGINKSLFPD